LTSALAGGEWSASRPCRFTPWKEPPVFIGCEAGWVPEPSGRSGEEKILDPPGLELRPLGRPARRQSPYRLHYPGSYVQLYFTYLNN
jgi:hypothetical protein